MKGRMLAIGVAVASAALVAPATASASNHISTATVRAYSQTTDSFSCTGQVYDDGDGGTMSVRVTGSETRPENKHFRTAFVKTRLVAQERTYPGVWKNVEWGHVFTGKLGPTVDLGAFNQSPFAWRVAPGVFSTAPTLSISVGGFDDLFRVKTVTRVYDDEGVKVATLVTRNGTCQL